MGAAERFTGKVEKGQVALDDRPRWRAALARQEGKRVEVTLRRERVHRSLRANAYLWVVYGYIAEWSGHDKDEIHEAMKALFLPARELVIPASGEVLTVPGSTAVLDSFDFADYVSKVKRWAAEQGLHVPEPHEVGDL